MIGTTISHYRILEKLGEGGMGVVYKAQDTKLDRFVALKFLPDRVKTLAEDKARFLQEARTASSLNHPNVCTIHDIQEQEVPDATGRPQLHMFIVMEYVDGVTLREKLENGPLSVNQACQYGIQVGEALQEAHLNSIVHRDIKPDNVMVNSKNQIKVMDFGLAKLKGTLKLTKTSSTIGTIAYMSPEQIQGGAVDSRSDIFSFGVLLFEMLTCKLPFRGEHEAAMLYSIVNELPDSPEKYRSDVPPLLLSTIERALEKNPDDRYQSIGEMIIELRRVLKQSSKVVTREIHRPEDSGASPYSPIPQPPSPIEGKHRRYRQKPLLIGGAAVVVLLVAIAVYYVATSGRSGSGTTFSFDSMQITRLTSSGTARTAVVSPDGKYVVYALEEKGRQSLWVRQIATGSNVQIIPPDDVKYPYISISHDGNYIYYVQRKLASPTNDLYQIPILGGTSKKLVNDLASGASFSPDGKQFTFLRVYQTSGEFSLLIANADGSGERILASHKGDLWFDGNPSWSPDGSTIASALGSWAGGLHHEVVEVAVSTGKEKKLTERRWAQVVEVHWVPDGSGLLVLGVDTEAINTQVWQLDKSKGSVSRLTNDLSAYSDLSLTGDGKSLCVLQAEQTANVYVLPQGDSRRALQITKGKLNGVGGLAWTPDSHIVYASSEGGNRKLWITDLDGAATRQLTSESAADFQPAVSPDGKTVLFVSDKSGIPNIWRIDIDGSHLKQLTGGGEDYRPNIAPDGTWFVFDSWDSGPDLIMRLPIDGGTPTVVTDTSGAFSVISPDGSHIAFAITNPVKVYVLPSDHGALQKVFSLPNFAAPVIRWTRDGKGISYIDTRKGVSNIWTQPLDGGSPKQVTQFNADRLLDFDWSKDGKMLAVVRSSLSADVLLMSSGK